MQVFIDLALLDLEYVKSLNIMNRMVTDSYEHDEIR